MLSILLIEDEVISMPASRRDLIALFPRFLTLRRRGWIGLASFLEERGISRPESFLLLALAEEADPGVWLTRATMRRDLFNPYSTIDPLIFAALPDLVAHGLLAEREDASYAVTASGRALIADLEQAARAYLATLEFAPLVDLAPLADVLLRLASAMWAAPEPADKPHQARFQRRLPVREDDAPLVRLEAAILALWLARDDAHNAAWRAQGFTGPAFDIFSRIWNGEAASILDLQRILALQQRPEDIEAALVGLQQTGYVARTGNEVVLTPAGRVIRDAIEAETDRVYFAPWTADDTTIVHWQEQIAHICQRFS